MTDTKILRELIKESGYTYKFLASQIGITRESLYLKIEGKNEFTASQIKALAELLKLTKTQVNDIFLRVGVN